MWFIATIALVIHPILGATTTTQESVAVSREAAARIVASVSHVVRDDLELDTVEYRVEDTEVTLSGRMATLWV